MVSVDAFITEFWQLYTLYFAQYILVRDVAIMLTCLENNKNVWDLGIALLYYLDANILTQA